MWILRNFRRIYLLIFLWLVLCPGETTSHLLSSSKDSYHISSPKFTQIPSHWQLKWKGWGSAVPTASVSAVLGHRLTEPRLVLALGGEGKTSMRQHKSYSTWKRLRQQIRNVVSGLPSRPVQFLWTKTGDGPVEAISKRQQAQKLSTPEPVCKADEAWSWPHTSIQ
jgi:hypothetical protein